MHYLIKKLVLIQYSHKKSFQIGVLSIGIQILLFLVQICFAVDPAFHRYEVNEMATRMLRAYD